MTSLFTLRSTMSFMDEVHERGTEVRGWTFESIEADHDCRERLLYEVVGARPVMGEQPCQPQCSGPLGDEERSELFGRVCVTRRIVRTENLLH